MPAFPTFTNAVRSQFPGYYEDEVFYVLEAEMDCGYTTTKCLNPGSVKRAFTVAFAQMSHDEMDAFEAFFESVGGTVMPFSFTDDGGTEWPTCKFVSPKLQFHYTEQGGFGVSTEIRSL